jgi:tRNA-specific 2-thiouridylase
MKKVFIGLSGGVDSAVSAALLKQQGYEVVGVFIKAWEPARTNNDSGGPDDIKCTWRDDRREAMRVAAHLDISLVTWDLAKQYKEKVIDYVLREYQAGRTPNPDVMCNKEIKFGLFYNQARQLGADFVATGHYAQVKNGQLFAGQDKTKDQSYFLWTLTPEILQHTLFPVGRLEKSEVRKLAKKFKLPNATRPDSQGVCFIGQIDFKQFLKKYLKSETGKVVNEKGDIIGTHEGAIFHTLGERHGLTITVKTPTDKPYYVIAKEIKKNILVVSQNPAKTEATTNELKLEQLNILDQEKLGDKQKIFARIRHLGELLPAQFVSPNTIKLAKPRTDLAPGQSVVIYSGDNQVLAGGIILS